MMPADFDDHDPTPAVPSPLSFGSRDGDHEWLRLSFVNIPAPRARAALRRWHTPAALLEAAARGRRDDLEATRGLTPTYIERLAECARMDIAPALDAIAKDDIWLLREGDALYPPALRAIKGAPTHLWVRGTLEPQDEIAVGIVGTRKFTEYGRGMAGRIARELARRGVTVVSGLAMGVDTAAHKGALEAKGRTIACCGCGLDILYPKPNKELREEIVKNGAMISEYPPTMHAEAWHFPARNRIIAGLSAGVLVVEAAEKSGALITADFAVEQGREVFALPGNVQKEQSRGPHGLIKQGATLVEKAEDILEVLKARSLPFERAADFLEAATEAAAHAAESPPASTSRSAASTSKRREPPPDITEEPEEALDAPASRREEAAASVRADLSAEENRVFGALSWEARHIDAIALDAEMGAGQASATLLLLELKRLARRLPGGMFERLE